MTNLPTQTPRKRIVTAMAKKTSYKTAEEPTTNPLQKKNKAPQKKRIYRFVSSMGQSIFSSY
jgi:hypothetical protein